MTTPDRVLLLLSPDDNVLVARSALAAGESVEIDGERFVLERDIRLGHKVARRPIVAGAKIVKYGAPIGSATRDITPGEHVHVHNVKSNYTASQTLDEARAEAGEAS